MMKPKLIKTEKDYQATLARLDEIFEAELGTADGDEAELLTTLIEMYEGQKYPIDLPDPVSAIKFRMEQEEGKIMTVHDLRELIQDDIITCVDSHFGEVEYVEEVKTQLCQIVVDRINEYEKGK